MLSHKNIPNGLGRAVYGGKPHNVPKALQSVNMKNTSERGVGWAVGWWVACGGVQTWKCRHVADTALSTISVPDIGACL